MSDSNVYTAEKILSKRYHNGVTQYHIKWKGYSSRDNTWEPAENIIDPKLIETFERTLAKRTKRSSTSSSNRSIKNSVSTPQPSPSRVVKVQSPSLNITARSRSPVVSSKISTAVSTSPIALRASPALQATPPPSTTCTPSSPHKSHNDIKTSVNSSPIRATSTPILPTLITPKEDKKINNHDMSVGTGVNSPIASPIIPTNNSNSIITNSNSIVSNNYSTISNNNVSKSKCFSSKFAIMNTVITDVTVNDQTITISESKTNQGFFKEVSRHSVAVDTTNAGDSMDMI